MNDVQQFVKSLENMTSSEVWTNLLMAIHKGRDSIKIVDFLGRHLTKDFLSEYFKVYPGTSKTRGKRLANINLPHSPSSKTLPDDLMLDLIMYKMGSSCEPRLTNLTNEIYSYLEDFGSLFLAHLFYRMYLRINKESLRGEFKTLIENIFLRFDPAFRMSILNYAAEACSKYFGKRLSPRDPEYKTEIKTWSELICNLTRARFYQI